MKDERSLDGVRADPHAPGVIRLRQAVRAEFRAVVGEAPVILRVEQGRKLVRGAVPVGAQGAGEVLEGEVLAGEVLAGGLALLPSGVPLDVVYASPSRFARRFRARSGCRRG